MGLLSAVVPIPADQYDRGQDDREIVFSVMRPRTTPLQLTAMRTDQRIGGNRVQAVVAAIGADHRICLLVARVERSVTRDRVH